MSCGPLTGLAKPARGKLHLRPVRDHAFLVRTAAPDLDATTGRTWNHERWRSRSAARILIAAPGLHLA